MLAIAPASFPLTSAPAAPSPLEQHVKDLEAQLAALQLKLCTFHPNPQINAASFSALQTLVTIMDAAASHPETARRAAVNVLLAAGLSCAPRASKPWSPISPAPAPAAPCAPAAPTTPAPRPVTPLPIAPPDAGLLPPRSSATKQHPPTYATTVHSAIAATLANPSRDRRQGTWPPSG